MKLARTVLLIYPLWWDDIPKLSKNVWLKVSTIDDFTIKCGCGCGATDNREDYGERGLWINS